MIKHNECGEYRCLDDDGEEKKENEGVDIRREKTKKCVRIRADL